ncbi:MAG: outer membrane protein assembly factor BamE [Mariprofundaceae bacterium]|nr:outer membrane protein assembly factor BamE [Mariprofundaceae bacterium]
MKMISLVILCLLSACMNQTIHQGNVIKESLSKSISIGTSRTQVENVLGTPVLRTLTNNQAIYMEDLHDEETGEAYQRRVEITYDRAGTVEKIKHYGFEKK